jgi:glycosyltransferase involved in cell wall biosynthesis
MMPTARILFVHNASLHPIRGSTRCLLDLLSHLDRSRFDPVVWCNRPLIADVALTGATVHEARDWSATGSRLSSSWIREAYALVRRHGVALIHANEFDQSSVLVPVARTVRVPLLAQLHRVPALGESRWSLLHQADVAVGTSRACLTGLLEDGYPPERAVVIYNGVDPARLGRGDATGLRGELGIGSGEIVVTVVASFVRRKAIDIAVQAFGALRQWRQDCHLVLCGAGPERQSLEARAEALGVRRWIHFLGERSDAGAVLRDATDILLATSQAESFGLTLAEAGVFGVPAVASDIAAHREVLADGAAGLLVSPEDVKGFADALARLAGDVTERRRYGSNIRERVEKMFLIDHYVRAFQDLYSRMLAKPPSTYGWLRGTRWPRTYTEWIRERLSGRAPSRTPGGWSGG